MTKKLNPFEIDIFDFFKCAYRNIKIIFILCFFGGVAGLVFNQYKTTQLQTSYITLQMSAPSSEILTKYHLLLYKETNSPKYKETNSHKFENLLNEIFINNVVSGFEINRFIEILKDKKTYKDFLLDKSLDEKTYIPNIKTYIKIDSESGITNILNINKVTPNFFIYIKFPINFDGPRFLMEFINFVKLDAVKKLKNRIDLENMYYAEELEESNKNINLFFESNNFLKSNNINIEPTLNNLQLKYIENKNIIEKLKKYKEILNSSSFVFDALGFVKIMEIEPYNSITKKSENLTTDIFFGFLLGLIISSIYIFMMYLIEIQNKMSKIFK
jgi:hypothetical protein